MQNDDVIYRQAAIDAIEAVFPVDPMKSEYAQGIACGAALAKTYIEQLPSAQPEPLTLRVNHKLTKEEYDKLMHDIKDAPIVLLPPAQPSADVVEVVRCKDCKHLFEDNGCPLRTWWTHLKNDFCSYGERREDE